MKKIRTKTEKEKKGTRNKIIVGVIMVVLLVLSTAGYAFFGSEKQSKEGEKKINYRGLDFFLNEAGFWQTQIQNYVFNFQFPPAETENISIAVNLTLQNYFDKTLYFVSDESSNTIAKREIARNLQYFIERMQDSCLQGQNCTKDVPEKNCTDDSYNMIIFRENSEEYNDKLNKSDGMPTANITPIIPSVTQEENCVFINSEYSEAVKASDAFLYKIIGIRIV